MDGDLDGIFRAAGSGYLEVALGDVDFDGEDELLAGSGDASTAWLAISAIDLQDYNGDGYVDLAVSDMSSNYGGFGLRGLVGVMAGPILANAAVATEAFLTVYSSTEEPFATGLSGGTDFDGDGALDLIIGGIDTIGYGDAFVYLVSGRSGGVWDAAADGRRVASTDPDDAYVGYALLAGDDWTGDGGNDFLVAGYGAESDAGRVWVLCGDW
ncbi:MAG: hypothetical protein Q8P41_31145 [Pseudomonadota bacterium]|nr:hypothetical protein [Pseudomonadota bacterium]